MGSLLRLYRRNIADGKGLLVFSIIFAIAIRIIYFLNFPVAQVDSTEGYLSFLISYLSENPMVSFISSCTVTAIFAVIVAQMNTKYVFIRQKTMFPPAILVLLFSSHPVFVNISAEYISCLFVLLIISILFASYNNNYPQEAAFKTTFMLALGSLFSPVLLIYVPILWISLIVIRCFNFKSIITSMLGILIIYFPVVSYYLLTNDLDTFFYPFTTLTVDRLRELPILDYEVINWGIAAFSVILLIVIISNNYINRNKDKIKVRAYLNFLSLIAALAMVALLFFNTGVNANLHIALLTGSLLLSHFYSLADRSGVIFLFFFSFIFYIVICFSPFLSL